MRGFLSGVKYIQQNKWGLKFRLVLECSWQNDVFVVAEPGELADKFVQSVKFSLLSIMRGRHRKYTSAITNIATLAELVAYRPYFQIGCIVHRYIGRQTQVCFFGFLNGSACFSN